MQKDLPIEYCVCCGKATGRAGQDKDSLYCDACGRGPYCLSCWEFGDHEQLMNTTMELLIEIRNLRLRLKQYRDQETKEGYENVKTGTKSGKNIGVQKYLF